MKETSSKDTTQQEFVELTQEEICRISGSAESAASALGGLYPEISNDPP
jgi:hypothetical protein